MADGEALEGEVQTPKLYNNSLLDPVTGRFRTGNPGGPGRRKGARDKLQYDFLAALADDFARCGVGAIRRVRNNRPHDYLKIIASLMPKQVEIEAKPFEEVPDEELYDLVITAREALRFAASHGIGSGETGVDEPAAELQALPEAAGVPRGGEDPS